jgi:hypothetical protein
MKLPKLPNEGLNKKEKKKLKIPKSQYDEDGIPILTIPDLNDINLNDEIDKYFGKEDE